MDGRIEILNAAIIAVTLFVTYQGFRREEVIERLLLSTEGVLHRGEYYRILTSGLVHANWVHAGFNMFSLYSFGRWIEVVYGPVRFGAIYILSIVGGGLLALVLHRRSEYRALGASGGVCGVVFASIFLLPGGSVELFLLPIPIPAWAYAILFVGYSLFGIRSRFGNIGHDAHLGGAIVGLMVATAIEPGIVRESTLLYAAVMGLSVGGFLYLYLVPLYMSGGVRAGLGWWVQAISGRERRSRAEQYAEDDEVLEGILGKISRDGMGSLSWRERRRLRRISRRRRSDTGGV